MFHFATDTKPEVLPNLNDSFVGMANEPNSGENEIRAAKVTSGFKQVDRVKFLAWRDNEADVSSVRPSSELLEGEWVLRVYIEDWSSCAIGGEVVNSAYDKNYLNQKLSLIPWGLRVPSWKKFCWRFFAELQRATKRASEAPLVRTIGNPSSRDSWGGAGASQCHLRFRVFSINTFHIPLEVTRLNQK